MAPSVSNAIVLLTVLLVLVLTFDVVKGSSRNFTLSKQQQQEDLEIQTQLNILNKPPIKTIHTEWGDILDCIDINKQPALDHPLLKDHKVQRRPSSLLKSLNDETSSSSSSHESNDGEPAFKIPEEGCPEGTVPIRRTLKQDLIRAKSLSNIDFGHSKTIKYPGQRLAGLRYEPADYTFKGLSGILNVYNPILTHDDQFSSSEIAIEDGPDDQINGLRAGWTVNPKLYGDYKTRLFILWTTDNYQKTGCFNTLCPGFVQVDTKLTPGAPATKTSVFGGEQFTVKVQIYEDKNTGDWWLVTGNDIAVGYWPKSLFGSLVGGGTRLYWGGHVKASSENVSPAMGSGHRPNGDYTTACFYKMIQYVDSNYELVNPREAGIRRVIECLYYDVSYNGFQKGGFGHTFLFGGPGGECQE